MWMLPSPQWPQGSTRIPWDRAISLRQVFGVYVHCGAQLRGVEIPANVVSVGDMAFSGCSSLETVKSYSGLVEVGEYAFSKCSMLSSVDLPSLARIGSSAFSFCASLKSFVFTPALVRIADGAFEGAGLESVDLSMCNSLTEHFDELQKAHEMVGPFTVRILYDDGSFMPGGTTEADLQEVHARMCRETERHGGRIDRIYYCTALTEEDPRRKPGDGMFRDILRDYPEVKRESCLMLGDSESDMRFAENCGIKGIRV